MVENSSLRSGCAAALPKPALVLLILGLICGCIKPAAASDADDRLIATTSVGPPLYLENGRGFFNLLSEELFKRLQVEYELIFMPAQRSLVSTNDGITDVIIGRTAAIEKKLPNLLRVPVNILDFDFTAYTRNPAIRISGWDSLGPYTVGIINGWKIVEQNAAGAKQVVKVNEF